MTQRKAHPNVNRKLLLFGFVVGAILFGIGVAPAFAGVSDGQAVEDAFVHIDTTLALLGLLTPFVTALIARARIPDWQSGLISAVVTATVVLVKQQLVDDTLTWATFFNGWLQILAVHAGSFFMGLSDPVSRLNAQTGGVGIGSPRSEASQPEQIKPTPPTA